MEVIVVMDRPTEPIHAPRGRAISCQGCPQEAALRMLMNNLDPDVAERWQDLVVYGGDPGAGDRDECRRPARGPGGHSWRV
jgi:urocanate hydratase